jgi:hypothetical protein
MQQFGPIFLLNPKARVTYISTTHKSRPKGIQTNQQGHNIITNKKQQNYMEIKSRSHVSRNRTMEEALKARCDGGVRKGPAMDRGRQNKRKGD